MKKIIAIAVAGAFAAPVMAADVTLSGVIEYHYDIADGSQDAANRNGDTPAFFINATSQLDNGMTVQGNIGWDAGAGSIESDYVAISGDFGKLSIGDVSGALDATGDWTDVAPEVGGFSADGDDHFISLALPTFSGASVVLSMAPEENAAGGAENAFGASLTYDFGMAQAYYGMEESKVFGAAGDDSEEKKVTAMGVKTSVAGVTLALESGRVEQAAEDVRFRGVAATYKMGNITLGYEGQKTDVTGASIQLHQVNTSAISSGSTLVDADLQIGFVKYDFGGGLTTFVEVSKNGDDATADATAIGVQYAF